MQISINSKELNFNDDVDVLGGDIINRTGNLNCPYTFTLFKKFVNEYVSSN